MDIRSLVLLPEIDNSLLFAAYAQSDPNKWNDLYGLEIIHKSLGKGRVVTTIERIGLPLILIIHFNNPPDGDRVCKFQYNAFEEGYFSIPKLPTNRDFEIFRIHLAEEITQERKEIAEEERIRREIEAERIRKEKEFLAKQEAVRQQKAREEEARRHFIELKKKYHVDDDRYVSPTSPLYMILLKLEANEVLSNEDIKGLEKEGCYQTLAIIYETEYHQNSGDLWDLVKAGKYWRMAGQPTQALKATEGISSTNTRLNAAIATNRGGAYRDLKELGKAMQCGLSAIDVDPNSFYAYNLVGAIYYQDGEPEKGDECFMRAIERGASPKIQDDEVRTAVQNANKENQSVVARYLLKKDPEKYKWADYYLK